MRDRTIAIVIGFLGAVGAASEVRAEFLTIVNPGFESLNVTLTPGEQTSGAGGVPGESGLPETAVSTTWKSPFQQGGNLPQSGVFVPGWRTKFPAFGGPAGVLNPAVEFGGTPWLTGYSGAHVAVAQNAIMQQTLNVVLQPSTTYTLSFLAGIGITDTPYAPLLQLLAAPDLSTFVQLGTPGVAFLAAAPLVQINQPDFGTMTKRSFSYTSPAVLPPSLSGKFLAISFLGSDGIPRMSYDDLALEATPVPAPAAGALLAVIGAASIGQGRRTASSSLSSTSSRQRDPASMHG